MSTAENNPEHLPRKSCPGCPFAGPKVGSKGNPEAPIVFVAESPGYQEVKTKVPLSGPSGKIFHEFVPDDEDIYVLNAIECCPPVKLKKEDRMNTAVMACRERLIEKIKAHPRRIVVAMGNPAVRSLTGDFSLKITQIRGRLIPSDLSELGIFPIIHVAALMRGTGSFRQWREDIEYALELGHGFPPKSHKVGKYQMVPVIPQSREQQQRVVDEIMSLATHVSPEVTGDIETTGLNIAHLPNFITKRNKKEVIEDIPPAEIISFGVTPASDDSISYCFLPHHIPFMKKWLEDPNLSWNWHNGKFDIKFFRRMGIQARVDDDTMLMSYTLDENGGIHDLETVAGDVLDAPDYKDMLQPYLPGRHKVRSHYERIPLPVLADYQARDTCNTAQIRKIYRRRIASDPALEKLYTRTLLPASEMIAQVEMNGIMADMKRLDENEVYFANMLDEAREEIQEICGYPINPGSPQQLSELLYQKMRFPNKYKGSTDATAIEWLANSTEHPIFAPILRYRKGVKMYGTYVKGVRKWVDPDCRVHPTFLLHGTRTGRLAAREPNMQNPPRDPQIRGTFIARDGYEIIECDLSQAELRSLAALSGDPLLVQIFLDGRSPHSELAVRLFPDWKGKDDPVGKEQYTRCKNVNFGIIYGVTPVGLADQIKDTPKVAAGYIDGWYNTFQVAASFIKKCRATPANNTIITTCFGRKKRVGIVGRDNLHFLQNEAANFPHQSIASDITLQAAIRTWRKLLEWDVRIVNLVHDAILMESPITPDHSVRHRVIELVTGELQQVPVDWGITRVPFESDGAVGMRWGSLKELKE